MNDESRILQGDVIDKLKEIRSETVQMVVTSPPYWQLRDYEIAGQIGLEETPKEYIDRIIDVFRQVKRVLKKDGTVWVNIGDTYAANWSSRQREGRAGFKEEDRDRIKKPPPGLKSKDLIGIPWRIALALQADGWYLRSDIIWSKPNPMPESVTDRPTKSHEYIFLLSKSSKYYYHADAIREHTGTEATQEQWENASGRHAPSGSLTEGVNSGFGSKKESFTHPNGQNKRSVWKITTQAYPDAHFATFPEKLPELCIKAGSRLKDIVLDPFMGSGTTCAVAKKLGRHYIGIELNPEYVELAKKRIAQAVHEPELFPE